MESAAVNKSALALRRLLSFDPEGALETCPDDVMFDAPGVESIAAIATSCAAIILTQGDEVRASTLLATGAPLVLLGEAALADSGVVERLASAHPGKVGIYAPLSRQAVSWAFETVSNADFKTVTPSYCEANWEVLKADGSPTGTLAGWWLNAMRTLGASHFLITADVRDDTDLNILAGLVEDFGDTLWVGPRDDTVASLSDWVSYGQCRQLALPPALFEQRATLFADTSHTSLKAA